MPLRLVMAGAAVASVLALSSARLSQAAQLELPVQESSLYIETDRDAAKLLETARAAAREGKWRAAIDAYQQVVELEGKSGAQPLVPSQADPSIYLPIQDAAALEIARLTGPALVIYREGHDAAARALFEAALEAKDTRRLAEVARRYLATSSGDDALAALGSIAFNRGDYVGALAAWRRLVDACPEPDVPLPSIRARMSLCYRALGRVREADALAAALRADSPNELMAAGGQQIRAADFLARPFAVAAQAPLGEWPALGGDPSHSRLPRPMSGVGELLSAFEVPNPAVSEQDRLRFERQGLPVPYVLNAVESGGRLFVGNGATVYAVDPATGSVLWAYPDAPDSPPEAAVEEAVHAVAVAEGRVAARLGDSVAAFDAATGRLLWRHGIADAGEKPKDEDPKATLGSKVSLLVTAPTVAGGRVFFGVTHQGEDVRSRVVALDAASGRLLWQAFVCSRTFPGFLGLGSAAGPPAVAGGTVYYATNLGALAALDAATGTVRWVQRYPSFHTYLRHTLAERHRRWANGAPIVAGGCVFAAPQDSSQLLAVDAATGALLWAAPRDEERYLVGADESRVYLAGPGLLALDRATGRRLWSAALPHPLAGRPILLPGALLVATADALLSARTEDGALSTLRLWQPEERPGNLAVGAGALFVAACDRIQVFEDWAATQQRLEAQAAKDPKDPVPAFSLGEHEALRGNHAAAIARFEEALRLAEAKGDARAVEAIRRGLFASCLALGRQGDLAALALAEKAAPSGQQAAEALLAAARLREKRGEWPEAVGSWQGILEGAPAARLALDDGLLVSAQALATSEIARLIRERGRPVYAVEEARAGKLVAAARTDADLAAAVRRFPNSAAAEEALLRLLLKPDAREGAAELAGLANILSSEPATPARAKIATTLADWHRSARAGTPPLTRSWQVYTRIAQRRVELFDVPGAPAGLIYFATARRAFDAGHAFTGIECRRADTGQLLWERDMEDWNRLGLVVGGQLYLATFDQVFAVDPASGALRWAYSLAQEQPQPKPPVPDLPPFERFRVRQEPLRIVALAAGAKAVYAGQASGQVLALSPADGTLLWSRKLDGSPLLAGGLFAEGGKLWACTEAPPALQALDEQTGAPQPPMALTGLDRRITDRPVLDAARGRLYVVLGDRAVHSFDLRAGRELWDVRIPFAISGILVAADGQSCYVLPYSYVADAEILSLDPDSGEARRRRSLQAGSLANAVLGPDALYMAEKDTDRDLILHALDPRDLGERWRSVPLSLFRPSPLAVGQGYLAITGTQGGAPVAVVLDASTGKVAGDVKVEGASQMAAALVGDLLCLGTDRGIHAYAPVRREQLDRRIASLTRRLDGGDRTALAPLASALYQRDEEERGIALLAKALTDEALSDEEYQALKDQLNSLRESLAPRRPPVLVSPRFATPPNIDGAINDAWRADRAAALDGPACVEEIQGNPPSETRWRSPSDLSARLYTGWDDRHFYFAVDVKDDIHRTYTSHGETWIGDGLIIAVDPDADGGYGYSFDGRDLLLTLALTRKEEQRDDDDEEPSGEYRVRRKDDNSGTVYEVAIPWKYLKIQPKPGLRFGFNVTIVDDDSDHSTKAISWTPGMVLDRSRAMMIRGFTPAMFGQVQLAGPEQGPPSDWPPRPQPRRDPHLWIRRLH